MELWQAVVLGVVEGLTEFVPVSSTGHLILVERWLGLSGPAVNAYAVVIQLGALLAAVYYYRRTLLSTTQGLLSGQPRARRFVRNLALGALPLLILGYLFGKKVKARLFAPGPVIGAILVGGVVMLALDLWRHQQQRRLKYQQQVPQISGAVPGDLVGELTEDAAELSTARAVLVGLVHTLALWPGTSRSFASITGGQLAGLSTRAAADFAFLLAIPTLGVATVYELVKEGPTIIATCGVLPLVTGLGVSFVVGLLVIAAFLRYLGRFGLWAFGCYRIVVGLALLWVF